MAEVSRSQLYVWLDDPTFKAIYAEARQRVYESALATLQCSLESGVATLRRLSEGKDVPANVRVMAAKALVEFAVKAREQNDLAAEMEEIKQKLETYRGPYEVKSRAR
jgi:uncharacterized protein (UPF0147 family)